MNLEIMNSTSMNKIKTKEINIEQVTKKTSKIIQIANYKQSHFMEVHQRIKVSVMNNMSRDPRKWSILASK